MILRKSFYIRWSAGRSPRVHEVNPGRDPSPVEGPLSASPFSGEYGGIDLVSPSPYLVNVSPKV